MNSSSFSRQDLTFIVIASLATAASLIVTVLVTTKGLVVFGIYGAVVVAGALYLRRCGSSSWQRRSFLIFAPLMISTAALHVFLHIGARPGVSDLSLFGHLWRLAFAAFVAAAVSLIVATLPPVRGARAGHA